MMRKVVKLVEYVDIKISIVILNVIDVSLVLLVFGFDLFVGWLNVRVRVK